MASAAFRRLMNEYRGTTLRKPRIYLTFTLAISANCPDGIAAGI